MKWIKRLLLLFACVLMLVVVAAAAGIYMYRGTPSWYRTRQFTPQEQAEVNNSTAQKLADAVSWAAEVEANHVKHVHGAHATTAAGSKTIVATEDELNAFFQKWGEGRPSRVSEKLNRYVSDGRIVLLKDRIVLAAEAKDVNSMLNGTIISSQFEPSIDPKGMLRVRMAGIYAGRVAVPASAFDQKLAQLRAVMLQDLDGYQSTATMDDVGTVNASTVKAAAAKLLLSMLDEQTTDPIIYLPYTVQDVRRYVPVKLTNVVVDEGKLTMTMQPLTDPELAGAMDHVRAPYEAASASASAAPSNP